MLVPYRYRHNQEHNRKHCSLVWVSKCCLIAYMGCYLGTSSIAISAASSEENLGSWPTMTMSSASQRSHYLHSASGKGAKEASLLKRKHSHRSKGVASSARSDESRDELCPAACQCKFFLWNFVSFYKYSETTYHIKQNTFEGKGGKKFVRIQPNTVLEKWYPQLRAGKLKTDACFLCGHSWKDHLEYWWYCRRRKGGVSSAFEQSMEKSAVDREEKFAYHKKFVYQMESGCRSHRSRARNVRKSFNPFLALARAESWRTVEKLMWLNTIETVRSL